LFRGEEVNRFEEKFFRFIRTEHMVHNREDLFSGDNRRMREVWEFRGRGGVIVY